MSERIYATYWLETGDDPGRAAEVIAGEQSSGTFVALAAETPELKARAGARVEQLDILGTSATPSLPTPKTVGALHTLQAEAVLADRKSWALSSEL